MTCGSAPSSRRASWRPIAGTPRACCGRRTSWWRPPTAPGSWTRARAFFDMMRRPSHRPERVAEAIRQTVAEFVTVTAVEVSGDLGHARVRVSVMGSEEDKAKSLEGLARAARFLRAQVAKELPLRTTPELHFELDRGIEHAQRIDQVLRNLKEGAG